MQGPFSAIEGKYEILQKISEGGMGAVYKVRHRLLDRVRVIKVMRPQLAADQEMKARFVREAQLAAGLRHGSIAEIYDFAVEDDGSAYLVMEYIRGITLQDVLQRLGPPDPAFVLDIVVQTLDALGYLHGKGIVHRDLSPDNVMVTRDEEGRPVAKLIDLGIAKLVGSDAGLTQAGAFIGKVKYASPELFRTKEGIEVDARGDLYSLGLVMYEVLTGTHPFGKHDVSGYIAAHLFQPPIDFAISDPGNRVSPGLRAVVQRCLAKDRDERFASAEDLSVALAAERGLMADPEDELHRAVAMGGLDDSDLDDDGHGSTQAHLDRHFQPVVTGGKRGAGDGEHLAPTLHLGVATEPVAAEREAPVEPTVRADEVGAEAVAPPRGRDRRRWPLALAVVAVVALAAAALVWWRPWLQAEPTPVATAPSAGHLIIEARPWAEVASVLDAEGRPVAIGGQTFTPVRLEVPPGTYRIVLTNGDQQRDLTAEVAGDEVVTRTAEFASSTADEMLDGLGL